jgi:hypothetical protein
MQFNGDIIVIGSPYGPSIRNSELSYKLRI